MSILEKRKILTRDEINRVEVVDNDESLVEIEETEKLKLSTKRTSIYFNRRQVVEMLYEAADHLFKDYMLVLSEGYRSLKRQTVLWEKTLLRIREKSPNLSEDEIRRRARMLIAEPTKLGPPHSTGGAVDVMLAYSDGTEVEMGGEIGKSGGKTWTASDGLTEEEEKNRKILLDVMEQAGFINYPGEWWHYSYGDRMWAAYTGSDTCFYDGPLPEPKE
ncbi:dipeptidase [Candidatus Wolfebacteria bacterium]|nr:MAG: dipeptidase [Candidatus Wolfebacteria bacterium]